MPFYPPPSIPPTRLSSSQAARGGKIELINTGRNQINLQSELIVSMIIFQFICKFVDPGNGPYYLERVKAFSFSEFF